MNDPRAAPLAVLLPFFLVVDLALIGLVISAVGVAVGGEPDVVEVAGLALGAVVAAEAVLVGAVLEIGVEVGDVVVLVVLGVVVVEVVPVGEVEGVVVVAATAGMTVNLIEPVVTEPSAVVI